MKQIETIALQLGFVDVNLDGVLDVLATGESQAASTQGIQIDLQAMDGKTGHAFWKRPSGEWTGCRVG